VQHKKAVVASFLEQTQKALMRNHGVKDVWKVPRHRLHGSGSIIIQADICYVLIADDLNETQALFVLLHEIGHKVMGLIRKDPSKHGSYKGECRINTWCIEQLKPYILIRALNSGHML